MKLIKVIRLDLLDELLSDYKEMKHREEPFSEFAGTTTDNEIYAWNEVKEKNLRRVKRT